MLRDRSSTAEFVLFELEIEIVEIFYLIMWSINRLFVVVLVSVTLLSSITAEVKTHVNTSPGRPTKIPEEFAVNIEDTTQPEVQTEATEDEKDPETPKPLETPTSTEEPQESANPTLSDDSAGQDESETMRETTINADPFEEETQEIQDKSLDTQDLSAQLPENCGTNLFTLDLVALLSISGIVLVLPHLL